MKYALFFAVTLLMISPVMAKRRIPPPTPKEQINWVTMDELQAKMKANPKKVYMDMYTDWCGWCKRMEATTFQDPDVIHYLNDKFYCVRFNAERKDTIYFMGKPYGFNPSRNAHTLAVEFMGSSTGYPTSVIFEEYFKSHNPIAGYQDIAQMEMILKYFGDNLYKSQPWPDYQKAFHASWGVAAPNPNVTPDGPPAGH